MLRLRALLTTLATFALAGCGAPSGADVVQRTGGLSDAPEYLRELHESVVPGAYLVIEIPGGVDFVQFTASPEGFELDMPLITPRQRELEPKFRTLASEHSLEVRESRGSDGSRFLDVDLPHDPSTGQVVQQFVASLFDLDEASELTYLCHGC